MKQTIYCTVLAVILAGSVFTSCESKEKKVENAEENVQEEKKELREAQRELSAEYPAFKKEAEEKIAANEKRIAELKEKLNKPGKRMLDESRKKRIEELEQRNATLRTKLDAYEKENSDWEQFKKEFNHDMDGLGEAINGFFKDNDK